MPNLSVQLRDRFFNPIRGDEAPYKLVPKRLSKSVLGGCKQAEIEVTGGADAVWEVIDYLRYDVVVRDNLGESVWWGYINSIEVSVGKYKFGITLDTMGNTVSIVYGRVAPGSTTSATRATTNSVVDAVSFGTYGTKERVLSVASATDRAANFRRDQELAANAFPVPTISWGSGGSDSEVKATLTCKGWWSTLSWRYAFKPQDVIKHEETNSDEVFTPLRNDANYSRVAQSFVSDVNSWATGAIQIRARRVGVPSVTVKIAVQGDSGGSPNGVDIDGGFFDASTIDSSVTWVTVELGSGGVLLGTSTTYWVVITIDVGTTDPANYVEIEASKFDVFTTGTGKVWNGSVWVLPHVTDAYDYLFIVSGVEETTVLMDQLISGYGQFFRGQRFSDVSGIFVNSYLDGDSTAQEEVEAYMDIGCSTRTVRYLSDVDINRLVYVYTEPSKTLVKYYLDQDGRIFNDRQVEIPARYCPIGYWAKLDGVVPATANLSYLSDPSIVFIDEAEYDVEKDLYIPHPRSLGSVWSQVGKIRRL